MLLTIIIGTTEYRFRLGFVRHSDSGGCPSEGFTSSHRHKNANPHRSALVSLPLSR